MERVLFLLLFSCGVARAGLFDDIALLVKRCGLKRPSVWEVVSGWDYSLTSWSYHQTNSLEGRNGAFPIYDENAIVQGKRTVMSLGEGDANYISTLIDRKVVAGGSSEGLHAVDLQYLEPKSSVLKNNYAMVTGRYRSQYHGGFYQNMDIRQKDGGRLQVDEMVSTYSLTFVLQQAGKAEQRTILLNLLAHLKPGGVIRSTGMQRLRGEGTGAAAVNETFVELYNEGLISNYTPLKDGNNYFVIQKTP